ncbi:hypothetical protein DP113_16195 [Brasilonema octagenarum UFV-E1]|uniref:Chaperone protein CcmS domain-containing protein n=1 Tax=Brasilonema sennae CENA114 TaxID=415709 RepID=A0A856MD79_9CYAN|nr:hypothetical protein [Brasilonema sennae]QDL09245.1 hypothetical protein DP114_16260 [Brasilonema sennae CENA114]QDL15604.1 hypothetical protein DP113_16195 [Brasilonema octagenarum UFV-E1]
MMFASTQSQSSNDEWRRQLNRFVKENQQELAALSWGLWLENGDGKGTIGIDLQPTPHFVYCPKEAIEQFNTTVENRLQEILGIVKHHKPEVEVLMLAIAKDQVKLIYFEPEPAPPSCYERVGKDVDTVLEHLEQVLSKQFNAEQSAQ